MFLQELENTNNTLRRLYNKSSLNFRLVVMHYRTNKVRDQTTLRFIMLFSKTDFIVSVD